jgi:eukaryotic-like serine/threonine-protein kinase
MPIVAARISVESAGRCDTNTVSPMTSRWVGEYEIVKRLSVGGMATLYLARRHGAAGFSRLVALKVIHSHLTAQSTFIDMFVDEARICSQITHPNVVHVEEFGVVDEFHYLVMEYIDGCSVGELLQLFRHEGRKLDPELAARIIMQIAGGLHAAHETCDQDGQPLDIVHRDISPSNIILSVDGNAKLIDFGIAKARNRLSETEAGVALKGKYKYVAPEQATRASIDRRSDIFSLGVVFWEMLVGQPLFSEDTHIALFNRLHRTDVPAPSAVNPEALVVLDSLVLSMLQHDPEDRPQTAAEVQRRIAFALPSAANREASEVGTLAIEVRNKRRARRGATEDAISDNEGSFSPTPRSVRMRAEEYHVEIQPLPPKPDHAGATLPTAPLPWGRRAVQLGIIGLVGVGVLAGVLVTKHSGDPPPAARVTAQPIQAEPIAPSAKPSDGVPPLPSTATAPPTVPAVATTPTADPALPAVAPAETAPPDDPATTVDPPETPNRTATPATPKRDVNRAVAKGRPTRRAPAAEVETAKQPPQQQPPAARAARVRPNGAPPISDTSFDDVDNTAASSNAPARINIKKTPIITDFGN